MSGTSPGRALLVVNPAAAGGRVSREWPRIRGRLEAAGLALPHRLTEAPGHAAELAEQAVREGAEAVIAVGGDGTLAEVAQGLHRAGGGAVGMIPCGTGNDAGAALGIPSGIEAAAHALLAGRRRHADLIRVGGTVVVNAVGIGLLGAINRRAQRIKDRLRIRGMAAYLAAAAVEILRYDPPLVRLETDAGFRFEGALTTLAVQSGETTGGGFRLAPGADPADGLLDACLVEGVPPRARPRRLLAAMRGRLGTLPGSHTLRARRLELRFACPLPAHLDGNQATLDPPEVTVEVLPGALEVVGVAGPATGMGGQSPPSGTRSTSR